MTEETKVQEQSNVVSLEQAAANKAQPEGAAVVDKAAREIGVAENQTENPKGLKLDEMMPETEKALELTEEESAEAPASHGVRGQIKKILRVFKDEFHKIARALMDDYKQTFQGFNQSMAQFQNNIVTKVEEIDKKHRIAFQWLFSQTLKPLDHAASEALYTGRALVDHIAVLFYSNSRQHVELENKIKSLEWKLQLLSKKLADKFGESHDAVPDSISLEAVDDKAQAEYLLGFRDEIAAKTKVKIDSVIAAREAEQKAEQERVVAEANAKMKNGEVPQAVKDVMDKMPKNEPTPVGATSDSQVPAQGPNVEGGSSEPAPGPVGNA